MTPERNLPTTKEAIIAMFKKILRYTLKPFGYELRKISPATIGNPFPDIPDKELYRPLFSPWLGNGPFKRYLDLAAPRTLVSADRCYVLYCLCLQALSLKGDIWECGVYRGGTAALLAAVLNDHKAEKTLHLFDTFEGMPETDPENDLHKKGDFSDTSLSGVMNYVGNDNYCAYHQGFIPDTFAGLETSKISFAHIDVDIYKSIIDCLNFIWPRLAVGGFMVFDDYGFPTCPGARKAVDDFFSGKPAVPLCLPTGQAIVFKSLN